MLKVVTNVLLSQGTAIFSDIAHWYVMHVYRVVDVSGYRAFSFECLEAYDNAILFYTNKITEFSPWKKRFQIIFKINEQEVIIITCPQFCYYIKPKSKKTEIPH